MEKLKSFILIIMLTVFFVSCQNNDYKNIVPKNANVLVSVDLQSLFTDVEIPESAKTKLKALGAMMDAEIGSSKFATLFDGENKTGIDWLSPFYFFRSPDVEFGLTMRISDMNDFEALLTDLEKQKVIEKAVESDGLKLTSFMDEMSLAYDDHSLLITQPVNNAKMKKTVKSLFDQSDSDCFITSDKFEVISKKNDPILIYASGAAFDDLSQFSNSFPFLFSALPEDVRLADLNLIATISSKKGRSDMSYELFSLNKKTQKLLEKEDKNFYKINGDFISAPSDFFIWAGTGVEGDNLLKLIKSNSDTNAYLMALDRAIDIQAIIKAVKGDMALVVPSVPLDDVDFVLTAKTKNTDFLKNVSYWNETMKDYGIKMKENSKNNFTLDADGDVINWGVDGDNVYFASKNSFFKTAFSEKSSKLSQMEDEIKNSIGYVYINLKPLFAMLMEEQDSFFSPFVKQLSILDRCCIKLENFRSCTVSLFIDSEENFLTKLMDVVAQAF